jgi:hypothetical protein
MTIKARVALALLAVLWVSPPAWAMDTETFLKLSVSSQTAYVAGVVDTLYARRVLQIMTENDKTTANDLNTTPYLRCLGEASYGTFRSATMDRLRVDRGVVEDHVEFTVVQVVGRMCPAD